MRTRTPLRQSFFFFFFVTRERACTRYAFRAIKSHETGGGGIDNTSKKVSREPTENDTVAILQKHRRVTVFYLHPAHFAKRPNVTRSRAAKSRNVDNHDHGASTCTLGFPLYRKNSIRKLAHGSDPPIKDSPSRHLTERQRRTNRQRRRRRIGRKEKRDPRNPREENVRKKRVRLLRSARRPIRR